MHTEIEKVWELLKARANAQQTVTFPEMQREIGRKVERSEWHELLDPIYEEVKLRQGKPDLTCIVLSHTGYPAFFSDGGPARSRRFKPSHMDSWIAELKRVYETSW